MARDGIEFLHYVAISRPIERLLIIGENGFMNRYKGYIDNVILKTQSMGIEIEIEKVIKLIDA
ncbi:hypothetical protein [Psychrobacillus psychrotolerans]|uniref:hypothetical protein n=1 Tax=Psychrobacillus psychrotolerans TaxID=126156 RepID=UPI003C71B534